jgi:2,4-dienoyl-CoA reductase-like NADH-dependent reductase (Old Yellow Enzyme family)
MKRREAVFLVQLAHSGFKSKALSGPLLAPSAIEGLPGVTAREMDRSEIDRLIEDFVRAAVKAKRAGADGVQLHNAHGYLLSAFFSPRTNRRTDGYGGDRERRARLILEIYDAIRSAAGEAFIIGVKTNCSDLLRPSVSLEDCIWLVKTLAARGLDFAEISAGLIPEDNDIAAFLPPPLHEGDPPFYRSAALVAAETDIPVYSVMGWRSPDVIARCLNESAIAGVAMCRPFICEPDIVKRWQAGDRAPSRCVECGACGRHSAYAVFCTEAPAVQTVNDWFGCILSKKGYRTVVQ